MIEKKLQVLSSQGDQPPPRKRKHYWVQLPGQKKLYWNCHAATAGDIKKNYWWQGVICQPPGLARDFLLSLTLCDQYCSSNSTNTNHNRRKNLVQRDRESECSTP